MIVVVAMARAHITDPLTEDLRMVVRWVEPDRAPVRTSEALSILAECLRDVTGAVYEGPLPLPDGREMRGEVVSPSRILGGPLVRRLPVYVRAERLAP